MNIQNRIIDDFINELLNEQTSQSQQVKTSASENNEQETLKNIKLINQVLSSVYMFKETIQKQKESKANSKTKSKK
jgi:protein subunit release factor B